MAYIRPHRDGYRVEVKRVGHPFRSQVCKTKAEARAWAIKTEAEMDAEQASPWPRKTVSEALKRYGEEVSSRKDGGAKELLRFAAFKRDFQALASKVMFDVKPEDVASWRDERLRVVKPASVQRDINLLRNVWTVARKEWRWVGDSPWSEIRHPGGSAHRERTATTKEIKTILRRCGYLTGVVPVYGLHEVAQAVLVALRTGMRAGEIVGLTVDVVDIERGVAAIHQHKTRHKTLRPRRVPLDHRARVLLEQLVHQARSEGRDRIFRISSKSLDALFRKARDSQGIDDLHFHDLRATFATRMARRVDVLTLAKILGHGDIKNTQVYYRETEEDIARRLVRPRAGATSQPDASPRRWPSG